MSALWNRLSDLAELAVLGAPFRPGPTGMLGLSLDHAWRPESLYVLLGCYIDESGTHADSPVMVLGGHVARLGQWRRFDELWRRLIRRSHLDYFHSVEMWHRKGKFAGWAEDDELAFVVDAERIAAHNTLFGFAIFLTKADYREHYACEPKPKKHQLDSLYGACFRTASVFVTDMLKESLGRDDFQVNYLLEAGCRGSGDATRIAQQLKEHEATRYGRFIGTVATDDKKRFPGLQIADATASHAWKHDRLEPGPELVAMPPEATLQASRRAVGARTPIYRVHLNGEALSALRKGIFDFREYRQRHWRETRKDAQEQPG